VKKKLYSIQVQGQYHIWHFQVFVNPKYIDEWRADGIEIVEIMNTVPAWVVDLGLTRIWCFLQDCWHLKNPFTGKDYNPL
jgi:hypothetical protein